MDEDIGMDDAGADSTAQRRRGRQARSGPMGERPRTYKNVPGDLSRRSNGRNPPGVSDNGPSKSGGKAKSSDPPPSSTIDTLRLFLLNRYSQPDRMLNMENMAEDPILKEHKLLAPGQPGAPSNMAGAIWKLAKEMFPDVVSLSLANNNLSSLLPLSPYFLTTSLPNIENVSFAQNRLSHFSNLDPFSPLIGKKRGDNKPKGWSKLKELVMKGNPMCHSAGNEEVYQREMAKRFATLRTLDQSPLDPSIAFQVTQARESGVALSGDVGPGLSSKVKSEKAKAASRKEPVVFPLEMKDGFFESDGARDFVGGFLAKFFAAFDSDRPSLLTAYAPICSFSFFADTSHPSRARAKKIGISGDKRFPHQHKLDWKHYLTSEGSRNLMRVRQEAKRLVTLRVSPSTVVSSIMALPKTEHPLSDPAKFVWDSWTMPNLLAPPAPGQEGETVIYAVVHGEFTEFPSKGIRSFSRTFILAPAPPNSAAALAGWPCVILSDLLTIRGYSNLEFSKPRPPPQPKVPKPIAQTGASGDIPPVVAPATPGGSAPPVEERAEGVTDAQQNLVHQLQAMTNLTYPYAHLCLAQNSWDPNVALNQFKTLFTAGQIPAEGFINGFMPSV